VIETSISYGAASVYEFCSSLVAGSGGRYAAHNHATRPWDYMTPVCFYYLDTSTRLVTYIPQPSNGVTLQAYINDCNSVGGTLY